MTIQVKVPALPESVSDATVLTWHKKPGDRVSRDENLVDLETDKVVLEVPAPIDGILKEILKKEGSVVSAEDLLGMVAADGVAAAPAVNSIAVETLSTENEKLTPAVRRLVQEENLDSSQIQGSGKDGRITREDVIQYIQQGGKPAEAVSPMKSAPSNTVRATASVTPAPTTVLNAEGRTEQRVPMSRLRARIAERLLSAQHNAAILTTFNEVNLKAVMDLRQKYKDLFEKKHGVKLGFMSLFTKAVVEALKRFPAVNASIDGTDIVYHGYYDIGIAVSTERGLVVPIIRNADRLSLGDMEKTIGDFAQRARQNQITLEDMTGGTFTITNGGVFGSLLATPILNPPQAGILGMHKIEERPVAENGQVVIRPMMYVALSYDHRLIDGKESVQFLVTVKELLEDPTRLILDI